MSKNEAIQQSQSAPLMVTTFYHFKDLSPEAVKDLQCRIFEQGKAGEIRGLFIIGSEGCNSTFAGTSKAVKQFKDFLNNSFETSLFYKDSFCEFYPFHELKVKIRSEIVTAGRTDLKPSHKNNHLSPQEWHRTLEEEDVVVMDTRNDFEVQMGRFQNAINPSLEEFNEFGEYLKKSDLPKEKKVLIYCTGGIRCEKAFLEMEEQGYENVYQLDGGIINYLEKYPEGKWEGECFVFDYRIAVDAQLKPTTQWKLCPHCGEPANQSITCRHCQSDEVVCKTCLVQEDYYETCSKNCAHHYKLGHEFKAVHKESHQKRDELRKSKD